jgi:hypothetical protein
MQSCESLISNLQAVVCVAHHDTPVLVVMIQHSPGNLDVGALLVLAIKLLSCTVRLLVGVVTCRTFESLTHGTAARRK